MYKGMKVLAASACLNEEAKIGLVCQRMVWDVVDEYLVVDDGSTDRSAEIARNGGARVISLGSVQGVGVAVRTMVRYAQENKFDVIVFVSGNNKDEPKEIIPLLDKIAEGYDLAQGSRFLKGGGYGGDMPTYRKFATAFHPVLMSAVTGRRLTESTNGFRAIRMTMFQDERINLNQSWLNEYELEPYILFKALKLGYRHTEVPVHKIYPSRKVGYTKMKPVTGWWSILRPVVFLGLGLRK